MKLLFITEKVDREGSTLGFTHRWLLEFSKHVETLTVICLGKGSFSLPANVQVLSLGKEEKKSRLSYIFNFYKYIWRERNNYDTVFVHMAPVYVILGGLFWKLSGKKIFMWYTHRNVDLKLRLAEKLVKVIFTASAESFRLKSKKVAVTGHGIDTDYFSCPLKYSTNKEVEILHVGRITKIKNCDTLIETGAILKKEWDRKFKIVFAGTPATPEDLDYFEYLKGLVSRLGLSSEVIFKGSTPNSNFRDVYCKADITVNLTPTGGVDKAVLESMSCGVPALSSNQTFLDYFGVWNERLIFEERNPVDLAKKIKNLFENDIKDLRVYLQGVAKERASVDILIDRIVKSIQ